MPAYMYHWTHRTNLASIAATGLDPAYSRGRRKVVWMCEASRVAWAVGHVAAHHQVDPDQMTLLRIRVDGLNLIRTSWPVVRVSETRIPASRIAGCRELLDTQWHSIRQHRPHPGTSPGRKARKRK